MLNWLQNIFAPEATPEKAFLSIRVNKSFPTPGSSGLTAMPCRMTGVESNLNKAGAKMTGPANQDFVKASFLLSREDLLVELQKPNAVTASAHIIPLHLEENGNFDLKAFSKRISQALAELGFTFENRVEEFVAIEAMAKTWNAEKGYRGAQASLQSPNRPGPA